MTTAVKQWTVQIINCTWQVWKSMSTTASQCSHLRRKEMDRPVILFLLSPIMTVSVLFNVERNLVLHVPFSLYHGIKMNVSIFTSYISSDVFLVKTWYISRKHILFFCDIATEKRCTKEFILKNKDVSTCAIILMTTFSTPDLLSVIP